MRWPWQRDRDRLARARRVQSEVRAQRPEIERKAERARRRIESNHFGALFHDLLGGGES